MIRFLSWPRFFFAPVACLSLLASSLSSHAAEKLPVEAWGSLPQVFSASLSPDGTRIAFARNFADGAQVAYATEIATGKRLAAANLRTVQKESEQPVLRSLSFANNDRLVYLTQATFSQMRGLPPEAMAPGRSRIDYWHSGILDIDTGKSRLISRNERQDWGIAFLELITPVDGEPDRGRMMLRSSPYKGSQTNVYNVNLSNGRTSLHSRGHSYTRDWAFGPGGKPMARIDVDETTNRWTLYAINGREESEVASDVGETGITRFAGVTESGDYAFVDRLPGGSHDVVYTIKAGSKEKTVLFAHPQIDVDGVITDVWRNTVIGARVTTHFPEQHFFDAELAAVYKNLVERIPDALIQIESWSMDRKRFIAYVEMGGDAGGYYLYEPGRNELKLLSMRYPDLKGSVLGNRTGITFPARDGTRVPAYVTKPAGHDSGALPTVLLVHGGPVARDTLAFDWWASFLASRGYLVVQPNYRGSGGYGDHWERAGHGQWGQLMQDDVEDAAHALVRAGMADPSRICIVGASYGGYATLVGATRTPDLFRCAASIAGVSDLPQMLKIAQMSAGSDSATVDWWKMLIGDPEKNREAIEAASPAFQAHNTKAPILLMHGANDTVVPIDQSERMEAALRRAGKDVEFIRFPGEDHWLSDGKTRVAMLTELERFLAEHLGSGAITEDDASTVPDR